MHNVKLGPGSRMSERRRWCRKNPLGTDTEEVARERALEQLAEARDGYGLSDQGVSQASNLLGWSVR